MEGNALGSTIGSGEEAMDGKTVLIVEKEVGSTEGEIGIVDGSLLGLKSITQSPQDAVGENTRVPVSLPYVPFKPVIVTREPVTAPTPPPGTHAFPPLDAIACLDSGIQLPCLP